MDEKTKYKGVEDLRAHWNSFGNCDNPITLDSLRRTEIASPEEFEVISPEEPKKRSKLRFMQYEEWTNLPDPDWLIQDALPERGTGAIWGPKGTGKTFVATDLAIRVSANLPWREIAIKKPGQVLYIAAEAGYVTRLRFTAAQRFLGLDRLNIPLMIDRPTFVHKDGRNVVLEAIKAMGESRIVVVDTLSKVSSGADENSVKDMGAVVDFSRTIEETINGLVLVLHHANNNGTMRGSSVLTGDFDVEWCVTFADEKKDVHNWEDERQVRVSKMRNAPDGAIYKFKLAKIDKTCRVDWAPNIASTDTDFL